MVKNRVSDLVKTKALKRVANQPGVVVLGKVPTATIGAVATATAAVLTPVATKKPSHEESKGSKRKLSLKDALIQALTKSSRPLKAQQLADKVVRSEEHTS